MRHSLIPALLLTGSCLLQAQAPRDKLLLAVNRQDNSVSVFKVAGGASLLKTLPVGKLPRELCLAPDGKRAYVSNTAENSSTVLDLDGLSAVGTISNPEMQAPDGCVVSPDSRKVYITAARKNSVFVFSAESLKLLKEIPAGQQPRRAVFSPDGKKLYVANARSNSLSVIDPSTDTVKGTIKVGREPRNMLYTADGKYLIVCNIEDDTLSFIQSDTGEVDTVVGVVQSPQRLWLTRDGELLFVLGRLGDVLGIVSLRPEAESRRIIHTVPLGTRLPWSMTGTDDGKYLYISFNGDDSIAVFDLQLMKITGRLRAGKEPSDLAFRR